MAAWDTDEVFLGLGEGLRVAEGLADALLGLRDRPPRFHRVLVCLVEEGRDAGDAVFDPLDEAEATFQERLLRHDEH